MWRKAFLTDLPVDYVNQGTKMYVKYGPRKTNLQRKVSSVKVYLNHPAVISKH
jgi:hypothetical protein